MEIEQGGNSSTNITTLYRADGSKLKKINTTTTTGIVGYSTTIDTTDYLDGFQYLESKKISDAGTTDGDLEMDLAMEREAFTKEESKTAAIAPPGGGGTDNSFLHFFPTAEGFFDFVENKYIYQYKDHLGNTRLSFAKNQTTQSAEVLDKNDYYPFGMNHLDSNAGSFFGQSSYKNYKYNGKELQETGMYDYGARMYMPDIGRWGVIDPLAEKMRRHSPYNYAFNNPISFVDPDGRAPAYNWDTGKYMDGNKEVSFDQAMAYYNPPNEYDVNLKTGEVKKISDLGGDEIDFYHYTGGGSEFDGKTRIVDRESGADQWMSSSKNLKGYAHRGNAINWESLYDEFIGGNGPENSLLAGQKSVAVNEMMNTRMYSDAVEYFLNTSTNDKVSYAASFGVGGAIRENTNMQGQFMGKTNFSFYPVGNKVVIMGFDSKSVSSYSFNPLNKAESRNIPRINGVGGSQSTTRQTYLLWVDKKNMFKK